MSTVKDPNLDGGGYEDLSPWTRANDGNTYEGIDVKALSKEPGSQA